VEQVIGDLVGGERGRGVEVDARRDDGDGALGDGDVLGVATATVNELSRRDVDRLANAQRSHVGAGGDDHAAHLDAGNRRQRRHPRISAASHEHLGHVHADGVGFHEHIVRPGHRRRQIHVRENLGPSGSRDLNGLHG